MMFAYIPPINTTQEVLINALGKKKEWWMCGVTRMTLKHIVLWFKRQHTTYHSRKGKAMMTENRPIFSRMWEFRKSLMIKEHGKFGSVMRLLFSLLKMVITECACRNEWDGIQARIYFLYVNFSTLLLTG